MHWVALDKSINVILIKLMGYTAQFWVRKWLKSLNFNEAPQNRPIAWPFDFTTI